MTLGGLIAQVLREHGKGWQVEPSTVVEGNWLVGPPREPHVLLVTAKGEVWAQGRATGESLMCRRLLIDAIVKQGSAVLGHL